MKFLPRFLSDLFSSKEEAQLKSRPARPIRFLLAGHDLKFTDPIRDYFSNDPRYEFRVDEHPGHEIASEKQSRECLAWADVIFCEWAMGNLVWYSKHKRPGQLLFARLHSQEWNYRERLGHIYQADWNKVDKLLLVTPLIYDHMVKEFPVLGRSKAQVMNCPIDLRAYAGTWQKERNPYSLGFVGMVPAMKRLDLAVDMLTLLQERHPEFSLHIKGKRPEEYPWMLQREEEMQWYARVFDRIKDLPNPESVVFYEFGSDMPEWYSTVSFLLSTSDHEGCHLSTAESMLAGCVPSIRDWKGANRIYPARFVWSTPEEGAQKILEMLEKDGLKDASAFSRAYAEEGFSEEILCKQLDARMMRYFESQWPAVVSEPWLETGKQLLPNILFLGYVAPGNRGGYRIRIEQEIRAWARTGAHVFFACCHPGADQAALKALKKELDSLPCTVSLHETPNFFDMNLDAAGAKGLLDSLEKVVQEEAIDIIHAEALYAARIGSLMKERRPEVKLFFDCHGVSPEEETMGGAAEARVEKVEELEMATLFRTDLNVFVSQAMAKHFQDKYAYRGENYRILPCCVAESQFMDGDVVETALPAIPDEALVLAYVGTLAAWQCGEEMLRIFSQLRRKEPRLHFLLLLPEKEHGQARQWFVQYDIPEAAITMLEAGHAEVPHYLQAAHAGLLLRRSDPVNEVASPTKFGEYLAAGLPVLLTEGIGDFSAVVKEQGLGMIVDTALLDGEEAPEESLNGLLQFLKEASEDRDAMRSRCIAYTRETLHWESHAYDFLKAISDLKL